MISPVPGKFLIDSIISIVGAGGSECPVSGSVKAVSVVWRAWLR